MSICFTFTYIKPFETVANQIVCETVELVYLCKDYAEANGITVYSIETLHVPYEVVRTNY